MSIIKIGEDTIECIDGESLLKCLLRNKIDIPYSCRVGTCQSCLLQMPEGEVPPAIQVGLNPTLRTQNYFLACQYYPDKDITVTSLDASNPTEICHEAIILAKQELAETVLQIKLRPSDPIEFKAGQFINIRRADGLVRSYSIANTPDRSGVIELHIKRMSNGEMSNWLFDSVKVGEVINVYGPMGSCFYIGENQAQKLLLIATGTGMAPLLGILNDAIKSKHQGEIAVYHGSRHADGFYMHDYLRDLSNNNENVIYQGCLSGSVVPADFVPGRANDVALQQHTNLKDYRVYLCGLPDMVRQTQKRAHLAGAAMNDIHADPFDMKDLRQVPRL